MLKVIEIALNELGYHEKATNASLDDKTANSGSGNYTKYARDLAMANYYNGNKNGYAWCDVFVDWCFFKAYGKELGEKMQCGNSNQNGCGAGCQYSANAYKNAGRFFKDPEVGDQIFFGVTGGEYHTGLVVEVSAKSVVVVEGNAADKVSRNTYSKSNKNIGGYGRPLYDLDEPDEEEILVVDEDLEDDIIFSIPLNVLVEGNIGKDVKLAQFMLTELGYPVGRWGIDGEFGPDTYVAVRKFQVWYGLEPTGIIDRGTWFKMLEQMGEQ